MPTKSKSCDGWNVRVETAGRSHWLHFLSDPTEQQITEAVIAFEQQLFAEAVAKQIDENEELLT